MNPIEEIPVKVDPNSNRLIPRVRLLMRQQNKSIRTERTYIYWILRYLRFHKLKHPSDMGALEVEQFLTHLTVVDNASPSTQGTALNALVFLYKQFLQTELGDLNFQLAKRHRKQPVVFSEEEARSVIHGLKGSYRIMASLMYGSGLRIGECISLRVKDVDFDMKQLVVRSGKGGKDRVTVLPSGLITNLQQQVAKVLELHKSDLDAGYGEVYLPYALAKKYPSAPKESAWQYLFPSAKISRDPRTGVFRRHHVHARSVQRAVKKAIREANIKKAANCHTFRHSFATQMLSVGYDIRTIQELLGHSDLATTEIYTHVLNKGGKGVISPIDRLG